VKKLKEEDKVNALVKERKEQQGGEEEEEEMCVF
jgi:hypothetical protein